MLTILEFNQLAEQLFLQIEQKVDDFNLTFNCDIDCLQNGNVLEITFENQSKIILNRQEPLRQIWLATKENGFHFEFKNNQWICNRTNRIWSEVFENALKNQAITTDLGK